MAHVCNDRRSPRQASWSAGHAPLSTTMYGSSQSSDWQAPAALSPASLRRASSGDAAPHGGVARAAAENEAFAGSRDGLSYVPSMPMMRCNVHAVQSRRIAVCWSVPLSEPLRTAQHCNLVSLP